MKNFLLVAGALLLINFTATSVSAQTQDTTKNAAAAQGASDVVGALASNSDYSSALAAVKAAKLDSTLKVGGPYTIFAPNNVAFSNLSAGQRDSLMNDPTKLATVLKGHVVAGKYDKADIIKALNAGKGKAVLTTLDGKTLTLSVSTDKKLQITNDAGNTAQVVLYDLIGANGVVNGVNKVILPKP